MSKLKKLLKKIGACEEAIDWIGERDLKTCWAQCERGNWMLWLCGSMNGERGWPTKKNIALAVCDFVESALPVFENEYPEDKRPRNAIETLRKWANEEVSIEDVMAIDEIDSGLFLSFRSTMFVSNAVAAAVMFVTADDAPGYADDAAAFAAAALSKDDDDARSAALKEFADICRARLIIPVEKY